jgi:branched-chain amino acid transport system ATP-binding protein
MTASIPAPLLSIEAVAKHFGGVVALDDVSFPVQPSAVLGLIGPNGSGKTTLLNVINGVLAPDRGAVKLAGIRIDGKRSCDLAAAGVSRTFQSARVFRTLTVRQNLFIPLLHRAAIARSAAVDRADELLDLVSLRPHADRIASEISGGQQRLLEFARALVTRPRLVLMDEPFAGIHPEIKALLIRSIRKTVAQEATSFVIVSHEVPELVNMSDFMVCLVEGKVASAGMPLDVIHNERVIEGYLGRA